MKVIDLLNKIANGEEVPKKIKWLGQIYEYNCKNRFYYQNSWSMYRDFYTEGNCLNDEVEIIEEEKEIEKIDNEHDFYCYTRYDSFKNDIDKVLYLINGINATNDRITDTNLKLNELIDEVKKLKEE